MPRPAFEDLESGGENFNKGSFSNKEVRKGLLMRVYNILTCQLALTFGLIMIFSYVDTVKEFSKETRWLVWVGLGALFALKVLLLFIEKVRRKTPFNYILLGVFTLVGGFFGGGRCGPFQDQLQLVCHCHHYGPDPGSHPPSLPGTM